MSYYKFILTAIVAGSAIGVGAQSQPSPAGDGIAAIKAYQGTWKLKADSFDTTHSKARHDENEIRNDCWRSGNYYACNQYVDGESKILLVFTFDADKKIYTSYLIPADGSAASSGTLEIQGDTWMYPWQSTEDGHTTYYRVVNVFKSPKLIEYRREFSADKVNWVVMSRGSEIRTN